MLVLALVAVILLVWIGIREGFSIKDVGATVGEKVAFGGKTAGIEVADFVTNRVAPVGQNVGSNIADGTSQLAGNATQQATSAFESDDAGMDTCLQKARDMCVGTKGRGRDACIGKNKIICVETKALLEGIQDDASAENMEKAAAVLRSCNDDGIANKGIFKVCKGLKGRKRMKCVIPLRKQCFEDKFMKTWDKN